MLAPATEELAVVQRVFPEAELLFDEERIAAHVQEVAFLITAEHLAETGGQPLKLVVVLDGAMPYSVDLGRALATAGLAHVVTDSIQLSRYGDSQAPTETPRLLKGLRYPIKGEHVVVVEDILDGGLTLKHLVEAILLPEEPASLSITALIRRKGAQHPAAPRSDFETLEFDDDRFALGYGLDYAKGLGRHLRSVYLVPRPAN